MVPHDYELGQMPQLRVLLKYQLSRCVARQLHASRQRQQRVRHTPKARRHPSASDLALVTSERLDNLIIFNFMSYSPYMPNLGS